MTKISSKLLVGFVGAVSLSACVSAPPKQIAFPVAAKSNLAKTDVISAVPQAELNMAVQPSNVSMFAGGGLLPALIDASVNASRAKAAGASLADVRDTLLDYDFDAVLHQQLSTELAKVEWLHTGDIRTYKDMSNANLDGALDRSDASAVLFVGSGYVLSKEGAELTVTLNVELFPKEQSLVALRSGPGNDKLKTALTNSIYRNKFEYKQSLPTVSAVREENLGAWAVNGGEPLETALSKGAVFVVQQMASDMQGVGAAPVVAANQ